MKILHLSGKYPDELRPGGTQAIKHLVACASAFAENHVISLHRCREEPPFRLRRHADHTILCQRGNVFPFGYARFLQRCIDCILDARLAHGFDLIHAHQLTFEGWIARRLSRQLGVPYCVSVRGTDFLLLRHKPHRRGEFLRVLRDAQRIAVISPWMIPRLKAAFGNRWLDELDAKLIVLGSVVEGEVVGSAAHNGRYAVPLQLSQSDLLRMNVLRTFRAVRRLKRLGHQIELDVLGAGSGMPTVERWVSALGLRDNVRLAGETPHAEMIARLSDYKALALFSYPETFGLPYLEAMRAGIPILHAKDTGFDGFFPEFWVAESAAHDSEESLSLAFMDMEADYGDHKAEVQRLQLSGHLQAFTRAGFTSRLARDVYDVPRALLEAAVALGQPPSRAAHTAG